MESVCRQVEMSEPLSSRLLLFGVRGHSGESVDVSHSWMSTKDLFRCGVLFVSDRVTGGRGDLVVWGLVVCMRGWALFIVQLHPEVPVSQTENTLMLIRTFITVLLLSKTRLPLLVVKCLPACVCVCVRTCVFVCCKSVSFLFWSERM